MHQPPLPRPRPRPLPRPRPRHRPRRVAAQRLACACALMRWYSRDARIPMALAHISRLPALDLSYQRRVNSNREVKCIHPRQRLFAALNIDPGLSVSDLCPLPPPLLCRENSTRFSFSRMTRLCFDDRDREKYRVALRLAGKASLTAASLLSA